MPLQGSRRRLSGECRSGRGRRSARWHRRRSLGPVLAEVLEVARRVQTWEASCAVAHGVAVPALLLGDRLGTELNEMTQDVSTRLSGIPRGGGVDGTGELVGLGEQMARTNGRHRQSVS